MAKVRITGKLRIRASKTPLARVFLSYAHADAPQAARIRDLLQRLGHAVFHDAELSAGQDWQSRWRRELEAADVLVVLLTPDGVESSWVLQEAGAAWALNTMIVPLVTDEAVLDRFPIALSGYQALKLEDLDTPEGARELAEIIQRAASARSAAYSPKAQFRLSRETTGSTNPIRAR